MKLWESRVKIVGSLARNDHFGSFCLWKLPEALWETLVFSVKFRSASHETGSIVRNVRFGSFLCQNCRKPRTKRLFWKYLIVFEAFSVKIVGSLARNDYFGSFFCDISRKPRTKRSVWKLFLWKLSEALCETLILEACFVKFGGSLAGNDHFGRFFCENCRTPRVKRSFRKVVLWNLEEASHEPIVSDCEIWFWWLLFPQQGSN